MLSRDMEDVRKTQTELLEKKITMPELKNIMDGINRSDISEEMNSKLEDIAIKTTKNETQSEKELKKKKATMTMENSMDVP